MRKKISGFSRRLDRVHRLAQQMAFGADVQAHVVAGGFDPVDLVRAEEEEPAARLDDEPVGLDRPIGLQIADEREQPRPSRRSPALSIWRRTRLSAPWNRSPSNGLSR